MYKHQSNAQHGAVQNFLGALAICLAVAEPVSAGSSTPIVLPTPIRFPTAVLPSTPAVPPNMPTDFTGQTLKVAEYSHTKLVGPITWSEHGYLKVTGFVNQGIVSVPPGLNSDYSLYLDYVNTGKVLVPPVPGATGVFDTLSMTLYGVAGVSTFGFDSNLDPYILNAGTPIRLGTITFTSGFVDGSPGYTDVFADMGLTFWPEPDPNVANVWATRLAAEGIFFHRLVIDPMTNEPVFDPEGIKVQKDQNGNLIGWELLGGENTLSISESASGAGGTSY